MKLDLVAPLGLSVLLSCVSAQIGGIQQEPMRVPLDPTKYRAACPDYKNYAMRRQYVVPFQTVLND
jgi:hypothetical protein